MQEYCDVFSMDYFEADVDRCTCLHETSSRRESFHTAAFPICSVGKTLTSCENR